MHLASWVSAENVFRLVDLAGVACNAIMGGQLARSRRFDLVGFAALAIIAALGGGMIRDVLLQQTPVALTDPFYLSTAMAGALVAFLWRLDSKITLRLLWLADVLCLGCWAATGAIKALNLGFAIMPALLMGLTTAVGGGMIRDVLAGSVPRIFGGNNLYATPAFISAVVSIICYKLHLPVYGMGLAIWVSLIFSGIAHWRNWILPTAPNVSITLTPKQLKALLKIRAKHEKFSSPGQEAKDSEPPCLG